MEKFIGGSFEMEMSLSDILGFENESDLFNKQAKVSVNNFWGIIAPILDYFNNKIKSILRITNGGFLNDQLYSLVGVLTEL